MGNTSLLERLLLAYLNVFTYGYGHTIGEAMWLLKMFITIEIVLMGLWWCLMEHPGIGVAMSKLFTFGVLAWLLLSWPDLMDMAQQSFIKWGIVAGGGVITVDDFRKPGNIFSFGAQIGVLLLTHLKSFAGWDVLFNLVEITMTGLCTAFILVTFGWLTIQVAVAMLEFYLGSLMAILLLPFGAFRHLAFLAEKVISYVIALGLKLAILALIISIAQFTFTFMQEYTTLMGAKPKLEQVIGLALAVGFLLALAYKAPAWTNALIAGVPFLSAGAAVQTAISMGAALGATAIGTANALGSGIRTAQRSIQGVRAIHHAAATGGMEGVGRLGVVSAQHLAAQTAHRFLNPGRQHHVGHLLRHAMPHE